MRVDLVPEALGMDTLADLRLRAERGVAAPPEQLVVAQADGALGQRRQQPAVDVVDHADLRAHRSAIARAMASAAVEVAGVSASSAQRSARNRQTAQTASSSDWGWTLPLPALTPWMS
ncbi:hypothetical protein GCM10020219_029280 [Nonomuraea dietziae]